MDDQLISRLRREPLSELVTFIDAARRAASVRDVFEAACSTVRKLVPACCMHLWMWDPDRQRLCRAHSHVESGEGHHQFPVELPAESDVTRLFVAPSGVEDADWRKAEHLDAPEAVLCDGSQGLAYLRLTTNDGLQLLITGAVSAELGSDFAIDRDYFRLLGQGLAQAIERIRLKNERTLLAEIARLAVQNDSRRTFFDKVARLVADAFDAHGCSVFLYERYRDALMLGGTTGLFRRDTGDRFAEEELANLTYSRGEGLTGWIFQHQKAVRLLDAQDETQWSRIDPTLRLGYKSAEIPEGNPRPFLGVPIFGGLTAREEFVGVIRLHGRKRAACFLPSDERRLEAVSVELARAIRDWNTAIDTRDSLQRQKDLLDKLMPLLNEPGLRSALETITDQAKRLFQGCAASILLKIPGSDVLVVEFDNADRRKLTEKVLIPVGKGLCGEAARTRLPIAVPDVSVDGRFYDLEDTHPGALSDVRSEACAPIMFGDKVLGVLNVDSDRAGTFHPEDQAKLHLLCTLAGQAALVLHRELERSVQDRLILSTKAILHQITDDLGAISGLVGLLGQRLDTRAEGREEVQRLSELSGRLSKYWEIFGQTPMFDRPQLQPMYLNEVLERAGTLFIRSLTESKAIDLKLDYDPQLSRPNAGDGNRVEIDLLLFYLIVSNLIHNAVEASSQESEIRLRTELRAGTAVLAVQDFGIGISTENRSKVFVEPFTTKTGRGNGLLLVGQMAAVHGGRAECTASDIGKGSTFSILLPMIKDKKGRDGDA